MNHTTTKGHSTMLRILPTTAAAVVLTTLVALLSGAAPAQAVTGAVAESNARWHAANNCPRPGASSTYKCQDTDLASFYGIGGGRWAGSIQVWECFKIDPFCRSRASARRFGTRGFRVEANGQVTATTGWQ